MEQILSEQQQQIPVSEDNDVSAEAGGVNQPVKTALYVGDLDVNVTDLELFDLFNQVAPVVSVRVCRDERTDQSLGYSYVNFSNQEDGLLILCLLNLIYLNLCVTTVIYLFWC